jgi:hypothetical protein
MAAEGLHVSLRRISSLNVGMTEDKDGENAQKNIYQRL